MEKENQWLEEIAKELAELRGVMEKNYAEQVRRHEEAKAAIEIAKQASEAAKTAFLAQQFHKRDGTVYTRVAAEGSPNAGVTHGVGAAEHTQRDLQPPVGGRD
jgi:hypothetical protein